jgi:hypothetical protein
MSKVITVATWSKARHFSPLLSTGIVDSNPIRGTNVRVFHAFLFCTRSGYVEVSYWLSNL